MTNRYIIYRIQIIVILLGLSALSFAQISAPGRDWADTTKYTKIGVQQDSIFVFYSSLATPKKGSLKAKNTDGSNSNFQWYKYDPSKPLVSRFVLFTSENGVTESNQNNLERGGYKVTVTRVSDLKDTTFYCWVMIDDVVITSLDIYNGCDFLEIITKTLPSPLSLRNDNIFPYWDIKSSSTNHLRNNTLGNDYFKICEWRQGNSLLPETSLVLTIGNPAPLYDSKYDITIINPFGRELKSETDLLPAKAAKADFTLYVDKDADNTWTEENSGEALLALKFDTKSINADSVFWQIINDVDLFKKSGDSIIWSEGYTLSEAIDIIPNKKLVPGTFPVEHIAYNVTSGCRDTMTIYVVVDSSFINPDAIPNVFTPNNGDSKNNFFVIKDIENSTKSIKTFKISILSRQGALVYSYNGNPNDWEGWDGKMDGSKRDAPEGVYYYIIVAKGWDDRLYKGGQYKGFLYLFRGR